jgi:hypothetical protein
MGAVQVIEVADQRLDAAAHVEGLQHVAAHEVGEVAHRLHRHRLVEQLQRLLVLDAEAAAEPGAIGREAVEQLAARTAQLLAQAVMSLPKPLKSSVMVSARSAATNNRAGWPCGSFSQNTWASVTAWS